jgi:hypothetical protein
MHKTATLTKWYESTAAMTCFAGGKSVELESPSLVLRGEL